MKKCGHDGLDTKDFVEGINKDTSSECFSPHFDLHDQAAKLAEDATFEYLEEIRKTVQNEKFQSMLSLSAGSASALAIAIDYSGSMDNEIAAVKKEILDIIATANAGGIVPSVYILAPYDVDFNLTVTKDTKVVEEVLKDLFAVGSGTENVFSALQVSLSQVSSKILHLHVG